MISILVFEEEWELIGRWGGGEGGGYIGIYKFCMRIGIEL